jgi:predicted permease
VLPITPADLFVPITAPAALAPELANDVLRKRDAKEFIGLIRLAPGVTMDSAESGLDTIARHLDQEDTSVPIRHDKGRRVALLPAGKRLPIPRAMKPMVVGFYAMLIGLILTIACMNLANMLLARGAARRKELAIRLAIGASRFRLIRQMMAEGILLATLGGIAGFALGSWLAELSSQMRLPSAVPIEFDSRLDWHMALFTFALAIVCGVGFSLVPALHATKGDVAPTLKEGAVVQLRGYRRFGMRNLIMVCQVAGSLMLLLITGFLVIGFTKTGNVQTKFDANAMYLMSVDPVRDGYSPEKAQAFFEKLSERLRTVSAVRGIALAEGPPFSLVAGTTQLMAANSSSESKVLKQVAKQTIGAGYFAALDEPMLAGREFRERDQRISTDESMSVPLPVVLNESVARGLFGSANAIGQRLTEDKQSYEVVGVAPDLKSGIATEQSSSILYLPLTQRDFAHPPAGGMTVLVRSDAPVDALGSLRREIAAIDPNLAVFNVRTLNEYLELSRAYIRLAVDIYGGIGVFGLVLAAIGLAGVTAYAVARRRKEIGIRMALGARKAQVLRLVLREGAALIAAGTILGFLGAMMMVKILSAITSIFVDAFHFAVNDPRLLIGAPLLLATLAMIACYLPARQSARVDPLNSLREE